MARQRKRSKDQTGGNVQRERTQRPGGEGMNADDLKGGGGGYPGDTTPGPGATAGGAYGGAGAPAGTGGLSDLMDGGDLAGGSFDPVTGREHEGTPAEDPFAPADTGAERRDRQE